MKLSLMQYLRLDISWISTPLSSFLFHWKPVWGRTLYLSQRHALPKERDPNKIFNLSFWLQMSLIHWHAWEVKKKTSEKVSFAIGSFSPSPGPCYGWNCLICDCEGWISLSQHYFYSSCSQAILQAVPFRSEMTLRGQLNLISNMAVS